MDYSAIYNNLIQKRREQKPKGYTENHHVLPKALGGSNEKENLVRLTGREHWIAHLLLNKIYNNSQTAYACHMMAMRCEERGIPRIKSSRMYEAIRKEHVKYASERGKQRVGLKNGSYGTRWISNRKLQQNKKIKKEQPIPEGWEAGRNVWNKAPLRKRLASTINITNGIQDRRLTFEDQLPIPKGWYPGRTSAPPTPNPEAVRESNKRRAGIKYNVKHKNTHSYICAYCGTEFERRSVKRRNYSYCSRRCSGPGNKQNKPT